MDGLVNIVDIQTHHVVDELYGHLQHVGDVKFSPNGKRLASAGNKVDALKVWDFDSGRELVTFEAVGPGFSNRQIEWSPDGNSILLMGGGGDLTIWRVPSFEEIQQREEQTSG